MIVRRSLLDTDILSEIIKAKDPSMVTNALNYVQQFGILSFTSLTVLEILHGLHCKGAHAQIKRFEAVFAKNDEIVPEAEDYRLSAEIGGALQLQGTPIGLIDPTIAACAIRRGYSVATGNTVHFGYIDSAGFSLRLENWRKP